MYLMNMTNAQLLSFCEDHEACKEGRAWVKDRDLKRALADCPRPEWIEWFIGKLDTSMAQPGKDLLNDYYEATETAYRQHARAARKAVGQRNAILGEAAARYNLKTNAIYDEYAPLIMQAVSLKARDKVIEHRTRALDAAYGELESNQRAAEAAYTKMLLPIKLEFLARLKQALIVYDRDEG